MLFTGNSVWNGDDMLLDNWPVGWSGYRGRPRWLPRWRQISPYPPHADNFPCLFSGLGRKMTKSLRCNRARDNLTRYFENHDYISLMRLVEALDFLQF